MTRQSVWIDSVPPTRSNRAVLEHAQQLGLHAEGHLADLVEEERPPAGQLEPPLLLPVGAGERAALVAEELALQQLLGQGGAVDGHQRAAPGRRRCKWIAWATSSLPVPVSPVTSTVQVDEATRATRSKTSIIRGLRPSRL